MGLFVLEMKQPQEGRRALMLSVGYGEGHHAAARAVAQAFASEGWQILLIDPCQLAHPLLFKLTQAYYRFCVRSLPWLWEITYAQTDTADWSTKAKSPVFRRITELIRKTIIEYQPDVVVCTYPLFAHMMDSLIREEKIHCLYGVVVTDAIEISRPWMVTNAPLIFLPDEYSEKLVSNRYALSSERMIVSGFPVRREFAALQKQRTVPTEGTIRIVYGAFGNLGRVRSDLAALRCRLPQAHITVLAGSLYGALSAMGNDALHVVERCDNMPALFAESHLYIGKAGAATVFEAYASCLPVIINYALPGQELGNLALLLHDGAGLTAVSSSELVAKVVELLEHGAKGWRRLSAAMATVERGNGADRIVMEINKRLYE